MQSFELGLSRANYRDYTTARPGICSAEPRWLQGELSSVNGLLSRWLDRTSAGYDGDWSREDLELLQKGSETLKPLLETHAGNLEALKACSFSEGRAFPDLTERGRELIDRARQRMGEAESIAAWRIARKAQALWHREQPSREVLAKRACPDRVVYGKAQVYYALERPEGRVRWMFCDGAQVNSLAEGGTELQLPPGLTRSQRRRMKARRYLQAAKDYPAHRIDRPPGLPERTDAVSEQR
jgi:hypothetical protein